MHPTVNHKTAISLHAPAADPVALCAAIALPSVTTAPDWVHLLPAGEIRTQDGRGPYRVTDLASLASASLNAADGDRLVIDENHATDLAAPNGGAAPARGWIIALEARADGLWGQVEWTADGRELVASKAYRAISPVIEHAADGTIIALRRASLVNRPNLRGLKTLHQETNSMDLIAKLAAKLGLEAGASEDAILAALDQKLGGADVKTAAHAALQPIADAVGVTGEFTAETVLGAVKAAVASDAKAVTALQSELTKVAGDLKALQDATAREKAEAFVDEMIKSGRPIPTPSRDYYVSQHMANPALTEKVLREMPAPYAGRIVPSGLPPKPNADGTLALNAAQENAARLLGIPAADYAKTLAAEAAAGGAAL